MPYVPPKYPGAIPTAEDLPDRIDDIDWLYAARYNELKKELRAALTELGALPKGADADVKARLDRIQAELDAIPPPDPGEGHITILAPSYDSIIQGTWSMHSAAVFYFYFTFYNPSSTDGDALAWKIYLGAGTYTLLFFGVTESNCPLIDFDIDDVEVASFDLYTAATNYRTRKVETGIVIDSSGLKTLKLIIDGKNPSSTDYAVGFYYLSLWRTA